MNLPTLISYIMNQGEISKIYYGEKEIVVPVPEKNFLYFIEPRKKIKQSTTDKECISKSLNNPIGTTILKDQIEAGMKVLIVVDDLTRTTPLQTILPVVVQELNEVGVDDNHITILIALGTHRYMAKKEILAHLGKEVVNRVEVLNNEWKEPSKFTNLGETENGTPIIVNREVCKADYTIGIGSITPHEMAGWSGGSKIIQPGICGWETTSKTHLLAARQRDCLSLAGTVNNPMRLEIEKVAAHAGLNFIVNVIVDKNKNLVGVVAGDPVSAHRAGIKISEKIYVRDIPELADIVVTAAYPHDIDYWQGMKSLILAQNGVKNRGTTIVVADFPEGISPVHSEFTNFSTRSYREVESAIENGEIENLVCASALLIHARLTEREKIICVSTGLNRADKKKLGVLHADDINEALNLAFDIEGDSATIGIIDQGGEVLPRKI